MRTKNIIVGTLILTAATTIVRVVGMLFRIYLANTLGAEGIGLYQLILTIYMLMVTFATSGIRVAVSKLISEELVLRNYANAKKVLNQSIALSVFTGLVSAFIMYYFADYAGNTILNDERTILSILYLAPSLPLIAVSNCYKGYFYAVGKIAKPAVTQVAEQLVRIFVIFFIMDAYLPRGLEYGCAAVSIGMTIEELFSLVLTWLFYIFEKKPFKRSSVKADNMIFKILGISLPLSATSYLNAILRTVENTMIPARLLLYGLSAETAMSLYGMIKGMVLPILFFPSSFLTSLSSILIPSVAGDNAAANEKKVSETLSKVLHFTAISGVLVVAVFVAFPNEIAIAVYNDAQVGLMIKIISYVCPFMYLNMVISSMLNALGEQMHSFRVNIIESALKISIIYIFVPVYGFNAYLFALFLTTILNTIMYLTRLLQVSCIVFDISNWIFKPVVAGAAAGFLSKFSYNIFIMNSSSNIFSLISSIIILMLLYLMGLIFTRSVNFSSSNINEIKRLIKR
jgi:stage V sporulation protein B